jgi:peptidyl-prolyl cis-trans isomerase D
MLRFLRHGAKSTLIKFILSGIMTLAVLSLVLMDVGGMFRGGVDPQNVARVNDQPITMAEFDQIFRNQLRQIDANIPTDQRLNVARTILRREIQDRLLISLAHEAGLRVSNDIVAGEIADLLDDLGATETDRKQVFENLLFRSGLSEQQLINQIKRQRMLTLITQPLITPPHVPDMAIKAVYQYQNQARSGQYFNVTGTKPPTDEISQDDLATFFLDNQDAYRRPEYRAANYLTLRPADVREDILITEQDIEAEYQANIDQYTKPAQFTIEQAVLPDKTTAQQVVRLIREEETNMASALNDIDGSTYIEPDEFSAAGLSAQVEEVVVDMQAGAVSDPFETPLGFQVVRLIDKDPATPTPLSEVSDDIRDQLRQRRVSDALFNLANEVDDLLASGLSVSEAAKQLNLNIGSVDLITPEGAAKTGDAKPMSDTGFEEILLEEIFTLPPDQPSQLIETDDGHFIAVQVTEVVPSEIPPMADAMDNLRSDYREFAKFQSADQKASGYVKAIQAGEMTIDQASDENNSPLSTIGPITRVEQDIGPLTRQNLFNLEVGGVTAIPFDDGFRVIKLTDITTPSVDKMTDEDRTAIQTGLAQSFQSDLSSALLADLEDRFDVQINHERLRQQYGVSDAPF